MTDLQNHPDLTVPGAVSIAELSEGPDHMFVLFYPDDEVRWAHLCKAGDGRTILNSPTLAPEHRAEFATEGTHGEHVIELTITPSLHCPGCGTHGFIRDSRWVDAA